MKKIFIYISGIIIILWTIFTFVMFPVSCDIRSIWVHDTSKVYDTVKIFEISDCINYVLDFTDLDSSDKAELDRVFDEFIRKLELIRIE